MQNLIRTLALSLAVLALGACKQEQGAPAADAPAAAPVALTVPALNDDMAWRDYLRATVKQHMQGISRSPFMYYLAPISTAESVDVWEDQYQRQFENVASNISRGVLPGNMLAFGSPEYDRIATLAVDAFKEVSPNSMKDVRVLFIGRTQDKDRVAEAVAPSGAEFVFHAVD